MAVWNKRKEISGVSTSSMIGLNASILEASQESKRNEGEKRMKLKNQENWIGVGKNDKKKQTIVSNRGIQQRINNDSVQGGNDQNESNNLEKSNQRLKEKSALYQQMVRGEILRPEDYLVDFEQKEWNGNVQLETNPSKTSLFSRDMEEEEERRRWEREAEQEGKEIDSKREKIKLARILENETNEGRKTVEDLKDKRKRDIESRLSLIKSRKQKSKNKENNEEEDQNAARKQINEDDIDDFLQMIRQRAT
eukprot:TRINITY_DN1304_c0_g1_i3.p2 TRINITY_DN1304_c0_g1~~TRINITY_DN1304_c0_g1_i3.p2  ORF type:complete len:251 (-),score=79.20 TRINITY_DN1304_c0_g1_i3:1653-2405(-)